jgi:hypothetical protein
VKLPLQQQLVLEQQLRVVEQCNDRVELRRLIIQLAASIAWQQALAEQTARQALQVHRRG